MQLPTRYYISLSYSLSILCSFSGSSIRTQPPGQNVQHGAAGCKAYNINLAHGAGRDLQQPAHHWTVPGYPAHQFRILYRVHIVFLVGVSFGDKFALTCPVLHHPVSNDGASAVEGYHFLFRYRLRRCRFHVDDTSHRYLRSHAAADYIIDFISPELCHRYRQIEKYHAQQNQNAEYIAKGGKQFPTPFICFMSLRTIVHFSSSLS